METKILCTSLPSDELLNAQEILTMSFVQFCHNSHLIFRGLLTIGDYRGLAKSYPVLCCFS